MKGLLRFSKGHSTMLNAFLRINFAPYQIIWRTLQERNMNF